MVVRRGFRVLPLCVALLFSLAGCKQRSAELASTFQGEADAQPTKEAPVLVIFSGGFGSIAEDQAERTKPPKTFGELDSARQMAQHLFGLFGEKPVPSLADMAALARTKNLVIAYTDHDTGLDQPNQAPRRTHLYFQFPKPMPELEKLFPSFRAGDLEKTISWIDYVAGGFKVRNVLLIGHSWGATTAMKIVNALAKASEARRQKGERAQEMRFFAELFDPIDHRCNPSYLTVLTATGDVDKAHEVAATSCSKIDLSKSFPPDPEVLSGLERLAFGRVWYQTCDPLLASGKTLVKSGRVRFVPVPRQMIPVDLASQAAYHRGIIHLPMPYDEAKGFLDALRAPSLASDARDTAANAYVTELLEASSSSQ